MSKARARQDWTAADLADGAWRRPVDPATSAALAAAARRAAGDGEPYADVDRTRFRCPEAAALAAEVHAELEDGRGFVLLSGLPFQDLDYAAQAALVLGLADHVGEVVPQNYALERIVDVRDEGVEYSHRSRGYRGAELLPFHTDGAHLFALACLGVAAEGGETIIVSGAAAYAALAAENPAALRILERGFYHHRRGQHDPGEPPLSPDRIPVFDMRNGLLHCCYNRNPIEWAEREGVVLTGEERAALDALDAVLARPEMQLRLNMQPGDCALINNYVTLHARTSYRDAPGQRRHLLRVWMRDPKSRRAGVSLLDLYVPKRALDAVSRA